MSGHAVGVWIAAARPRTLPAAVVPVAVGTSAAGLQDPVAAVLALSVAVGLQIAVNLANDLFDGVRGVDTPARIGPARAVATGAVSPRRMRRALMLVLGLAAAAGTILALRVEPALLMVGVIAVLAALGYSGGRRPYASRALGEVAVLVFFGPVATIGSAFVQSAASVPVAAVASVPVGLLAVALMMTNNARDAGTDADVGKRTLAVRVGPRAYGHAYVGVLAAPFLLLLTLAWWVGSAALLPLAAAPLALDAARRARRAGRTVGPEVGPRWISTLAATARLQILFGALLSLALVIGRAA